MAFRRAMSLNSVDSADDSERVVERLLESRPTTTDSTLPATPSRNLSTPPPAVHPLEKSSPGFKWKETVLISETVLAARRLPISAVLLPPISSSPRTLNKADWQTASSDIES